MSENEQAPTISVVLPVKNGARHLPEVLDAISRQRIDAAVEVLVVDSGSSDGSVEIARAAGARVLEIEPSEFGHGSTRNLAAAEARGERIAFLTQDATPASELWLAELVSPLDEQGRVGLSFGPHLPRQDTSPMVARELEQFFGSFSEDGTLHVDDGIESGNVRSGFFSNVNSALLRRCWEEVRFREVEYAEDQAFARDAVAAGWRKAYVPAAAVMHAHDFGFVTFMRRYFDEYRGLRATIGYVEPASPRRALGNVRAQVRDDVDYMRAAEYGAGRRLTWGARSARHHAGRALFAALGSRSERLPRALRRRLSLEGHGGSDSAGDAGGGPSTTRVKASDHRFDYVREHYRRQPAALSPASPDDGEGPPAHRVGDPALPARKRWAHDDLQHRRGAGAQGTLVLDLGARPDLEARWPRSDRAARDRGALRAAAGRRLHRLRRLARRRRRDGDRMADRLPPLRPSRLQAEGLSGAGLRAGLLPGVGGAGLGGGHVQDGLSVRDRQPVADRDAARPRRQRGPLRAGRGPRHLPAATAQREPATVVHYAPPITPRRGTELAVLALAELAERRPDVRIVLFGDTKAPPAAFRLRVRRHRRRASLASLYNNATVGSCSRSPTTRAYRRR